MSAFADDPSHFQRWLATHNADSQGGEPGRLDFAQRRVYGRYIAELINPHLGAPGEPGRLQVIYGEGRSISIAPSGVRLSIDDGRCFAGDVGVLATGHDEAPRGGSSCYVNPWESPAASDINRDAAVLIRGTGLTMVDFVVSLRAAGHRGPILPCHGAVSCRRHIVPSPRLTSTPPIFASAQALSRCGASSGG